MHMPLMSGYVCPRHIVCVDTTIFLYFLSLRLSLTLARSLPVISTPPHPRHICPPYTHRYARTVALALSLLLVSQSHTLNLTLSRPLSPVSLSSDPRPTSLDRRTGLDRDRTSDADAACHLPCMNCRACRRLECGSAGMWVSHHHHHNPALSVPVKVHMRRRHTMPAIPATACCH